MKRKRSRLRHSKEHTDKINRQYVQKYTRIYLLGIIRACTYTDIKTIDILIEKSHQFESRDRQQSIRVIFAYIFKSKTPVESMSYN